MEPRLVVELETVHREEVKLSPSFAQRRPVEIKVASLTLTSALDRDQCEPHTSAALHS